MMQSVASNKAVNRMSSSAVAACMALLLLRPFLAGDCKLETDFDVGGDGSVQLLQAAAAANHAQAIVITLLEEYDKIFGECTVLSPNIFSNSEESVSEEGSDYEDSYEEGDDHDKSSHDSYSTTVDDAEHASIGSGSEDGHIKYLPYSPGDESKGSFEEIIERVLLRSREIKVGKYDNSSDVAEQHRLQSLQKAMGVQWLCFTPPSTINNVKVVSGKLLLHALFHSNILFREFALISMWRVPEMPIGAHALLSLLTEPLKQPTETLFFSEDQDFSENMKEFEDWSEYYSCDATYRHWLKIEIDNAEISSSELSAEEKQRAVTAAQETLASSLFLLKRLDSNFVSVDVTEQSRGSGKVSASFVTPTRSEVGTWNDTYIEKL